MGGRVAETAGIDTAAAFIAEQFRAAGIPALSRYQGYFQPFKGVAWHNQKETSGKNVLAILRGHSRPNEFIIFCAHYDHINKKYPKPISLIRTRSKSSKKDLIYNGDNDDASGVTAMLMLAQYFAAQNNHVRSIIFIAFAGEENGLLGSKHFVETFDSLSNVKAVINIEMIGRNELRKNSAMITGQGFSDFLGLMNISLASEKQTGFNFYFSPDIHPQKKLFNRSDNYSFALKNIPAHSAMSSTDDDKYYHSADDEVE